MRDLLSNGRPTKLILGLNKVDKLKDKAKLLLSLAHLLPAGAQARGDRAHLGAQEKRHQAADERAAQARAPGRACTTIRTTSPIVPSASSWRSSCAKR